LVHANSVPGDIKDVGIIGNVTSRYSSNQYAFFGFQAASTNFVYKIAPTNTQQTTSIIADGVYGNVQFGSLFLSNLADTSGNTDTVLTIAGGATVAANLYAGNLFSNGSWVLTPQNLPLYGINNVYGGGTLFTSNVVITAPAPSTSTLTGGLVLPFGGIGVGGNITSGGGFVGPYYGAIQTAAQTNITSVGTLSNLVVAGSGTIIIGSSQLNTNSLSTGNIASLNGTVNFNGANIKMINANVDFNGTKFRNYLCQFKYQHINWRIISHQRWWRRYHR
jgi:hypothetical protein